MTNTLLALLLVLSSAMGALAQCAEPTRNKVLLVGDSWAFFLGVDQSINTALRQWGHSDARFLTNLELAENGAETVDFLSAEKQAEIADQLLADPDLKVVHLSIGGNDVLGDWNVDFTPEETDSLQNVVFDRLQGIVNFILGVRPDIHILWSGYMYPNFEEIIDELGPLQTIHPFHGLWENMGYPDFEQLNTILNEFSATMEAYADTVPRLSFVNATGLMQHVFGQPNSLGVAPGGSYPPLTAALPLGYTDYPSPRSAMRDYVLTRDCFHLSPAGYDAMIDHHVRKFYHKFLMSDQYLLSAGGTLDGSISGAGVVSGDIRVGTESDGPITASLTFNTTNMNEGIVEAASIFLRRASLSGSDPSSGTWQVRIKNGAFGTSLDVEPADLSDLPDASGEPCLFGSTTSDGNWLRLDLPEALLPYLTQNASTQFQIAAPGAPEGLLTFSGADEPEHAPVLNLTFGDISTQVSSRAVPEDAAMTIFPNPTTGPVTIGVQDDRILSVEVLDMLGQHLLEHMDQRNTLDLSALPTGPYVIQVTTPDGRRTQRVVKR